MITIIVELATSHGGDLLIAEDMIRAAAYAGATYAKIQTYDWQKIPLSDPQRDWLKQSHLDAHSHEYLMGIAQKAGIQFFSTPFCADSLAMLRSLGLKTFKIASSESGSQWWKQSDGETWFVSYPWGDAKPRHQPMSTFHGFQKPGLLVRHLVTHPEKPEP